MYSCPIIPRNTFFVFIYYPCLLYCFLSLFGNDPWALVIEMWYMVYIFQLGLSILQLLIFCTLACYGFLCLSPSSMNKSFSDEGWEMHWCKGIKIQLSTLSIQWNSTCSFSSRAWDLSTIGSWPDNGARYEFSFVEQDSNIKYCPCHYYTSEHVLPSQSLLYLSGFIAEYDWCLIMPSPLNTITLGAKP